jgi:hypothetical protein
MYHFVRAWRPLADGNVSSGAAVRRPSAAPHTATKLALEVRRALATIAGRELHSHGHASGRKGSMRRCRPFRSLVVRGRRDHDRRLWLARQDLAYTGKILALGCARRHRVTDSRRRAPRG